MLPNCLKNSKSSNSAVYPRDLRVDFLLFVPRLGELPSEDGRRLLPVVQHRSRIQSCGVFLTKNTTVGLLKVGQCESLVRTTASPLLSLSRGVFWGEAGVTGDGEYTNNGTFSSVPTAQAGTLPSRDSVPSL